VEDITRQKRLRFLALGLSVVFLLACTFYVTHIDKAGGDDGKGHCSICLGATAHIVQPAAAVQLAAQLVSREIAPNSDPLIKQHGFASSLYIRPPPSV